MFKILFVSIIFLNVKCRTLATDPCTNYNVITDYKRSVSYISPDGTSICDNLLTPGWYRIQSPAGEKMPEACPPSGACGTQGSIWLQPGYPAANQTMAKSAYMADVFDCKSKTYPIDVKNCWNEYYVYNLTRTNSCPEAYCFGTETPCPSGQYSETGWTPGCGIYPTDTVTPTVDVVIEHRGIPEGRNKLSMPEYVFKCQFTQTPMTNYYYDIIWFINGNELIRFKNIKNTEVPFKTKLKEDHWRGKHKMNMLVKCAVRIRQLLGTVPSPNHYSGVFEAGLKVEKKEYTVVESKKIDINVRLTVPLGCFENTIWTPATFKEPNEEYKKKYCILSIQTAIPNYQENPDKYCEHSIDGDGILFKNQRCGVSFFASNWSDIRQFEVRGEIDLKYNANDRAVFIRFATQTVSFHPIWSDHIFPDIKVKVIDKEYELQNSMCKSVNDPHMTTFDGKYYEHHIPGEYILYKSLNHPIQVNTIYQYCNGRGGVTCNCGVAIKNADALFVANFCSGSYSVSSFERNMYMERNFCDDTRMSIKQTGNLYTFSLPTGTEVSFERNGNRGMTYVYIKPSELDFRQTGGLCGFFNKDQRDDFMKQDKTRALSISEFTKDWAIPVEKELRFLSLFDFDYKPSEEDLYTQLKEYCVCRVNSTKDFPVDSAKMTCRITEAVTKCTNQRVPKEIMNFECTEYSERYKREASVLKDNQPKIKKIAIEPVNVGLFPPYVEPDWQNGWTEESARRECETKILGSSVTIKCIELLPTLNSSKSIEDCIKDIKLTGTTEYVESAQRALTGLCMVEGSKTEILTLKKNMTSQNNSSVDDNEDIESPFETLLKVSCPRECSGNGNCSEGKCICNKDYMGDDCSQEKSAAPYIFKSPHAQTCDLNGNRCASVLITGDTFSNDEIQCKINLFQVYAEGEIDYESKVMILDGEPINDFSCVCPLPISKRRKRSLSEKIPHANGYVISISNGKGSTNFSDEFRLIVFNSACYECNTTSFICLEKSTCPKMGFSSISKTPSYMTIIAAVSGTAVFLSLLAIFIVIHKKFSRHKNMCRPIKASELEKENSTLPFEKDFVRPTSANSIFIAKQ